MLTSVFSCFLDCAGVNLYAAENATPVALDAIQILGKCYLCKSLRIVLKFEFHYI